MDLNEKLQQWKRLQDTLEDLRNLRVQPGDDVDFGFREAEILDELDKLEPIWPSFKQPTGDNENSE